MGDTAGTKAFAGPVVVDPDHAEYCGAYQKTNNIAELSALLMAMNYIHNNFEAPGKSTFCTILPGRLTSQEECGGLR